MLKRIVAERVRRSKRVDKFSLEEDEDEGGGFGLTHRVSLYWLDYIVYQMSTLYSMLCSHLCVLCQPYSNM